MNTSSPELKKVVAEADDFLPLLGTDHIELYCGNAKQSAYYYMAAWGFQPLAFCGLETGVRDRVSYVLRQDKIILVLTSPLVADGPINDHINRHGDGVKAIALWVDDAKKSWEETTSRGAESVLEPTERKDDAGHVVLSGIKTYGDTVHTFVERRNYNGIFMPGYQAWNPIQVSQPVGLQFVDHMVGNVGWGEMNTWTEFYARVMGFAQLISFDDKDISTEYTALMSKVMSNGNGRIKFPINEPAEGRKKSQIEEYIDFYQGAGVQHTSPSPHRTSSKRSPLCAIGESNSSKSPIHITIRFLTVLEASMKTLRLCGSLESSSIGMMKVICFRFSPNQW